MNTDSLSATHPDEILIRNGVKPDINLDKNLLRYSGEGNIEVVKALLAKGVDVDVRDESKRTPLICAAEGNNTGVITVLIDNGADKEAKDKDDDTALITAVNWSHFEAAATLLELGADINSVSEKNGTPLAASINKNNEEIFDILIEKGADTSIKYQEGYHALFDAVYANSPYFVKGLLGAGADINQPYGEYNRTALMLSITKSFPSMASLLVQSGADLLKKDLNGWSAMGLAKYYERKDIIPILQDAPFTEKVMIDLLDGSFENDRDRVVSAIEAKADINSVAPCGRTALMFAVDNSNQEIIDIILGENPALDTHSPNTQSALMRAVKKQNLELVETLLEKGASIRGGNGWDPVVTAAQNNNLELLKLLVTKSCDVININGVDANNQTAVLWASAKGNKEILKYLIDKNADVNIATNRKRTPLHLASETEIMELLIDAGADINAKDYVEQNTALHEYCAKGDLEKAVFLIKKGADCGICNAMGNTPLEEAYKNDHFDMAYEIKKLITSEIHDSLLENEFKGSKTEKFYRKLKERLHTNSVDVWITSENEEVIEGLVNSCFPLDFRNGRDETPLITAVKEGDDIITSLLINKGSDLNAVSRNDMTALHYACNRRDKENIIKLLSAGADPNIFNEFESDAMSILAGKDRPDLMEIVFDKGGLLENGKAGEVPLIRAARFGKEEALLWLLDKGANPNVLTTEKLSPLHFAVRKRSKKSLEALLKKGADPDSKNIDGNTPLMEAAEAGDLEIVKLLLENKADIFIRNKDNFTVFDLAGGRENIIKLIEESRGTKAIFKKTGLLKLRKKTPLQKAVIAGNIEEVKELLSQSCNIDEKSDRGDTALMLAAEHGQFEILELLIEAGADVFATNKVRENALTLASVFNIDKTKDILKNAGLKSGLDDMIARMSRLEAISKALKKGSFIEVEKAIASGSFDIDGALLKGNTPLHICAAQGDEILLKYFLDCGAEIDAVNLTGKSVLMTALQNDKPDIAEHILKKGASVDKKDRFGKTPLHYAAGLLNDDMVEKLLKKGAYVDSTDEYGETALFKAATASRGLEEEELIRANVIITLTRAGIDVNRTCKNDYTALMQTIITSNGDEKLKSVKKLLEAGADPSLLNMYENDALYYAEGKEEIEKVIREHI